ncbi:MAG: host attachment family protein [Hyphomonadaceae bacterium]
MSGLRIDHGAWVMVGDGERALFLRNEGDAEYPNLQVVDVWNHENPSTSEQGADRPGRSFTSMSDRRSAVQETDWHRLEKHLFAGRIAEGLNEAARRGRYKHLVIVAPPVILGELRKSLHKDVTDKVMAEVAKDLTHMPVYEIEKALTK